MSTGAVVAVVVGAAGLVVLLAWALPRMRHSPLERELISRRGAAARDLAAGGLDRDGDMPPARPAPDREGETRREAGGRREAERREGPAR
jgi:hypothetical protein